MDFHGFISALLTDWIGLMSGGASLILTAWGFFRKAEQQRRMFWIAGLFCFFLASVSVWTKEHRDQEKLRTALEDKKPSPVGKIERVSFGVVREPEPRQIDGKELEGKPVVFLIVSIRNQGADSIF